MPVQDSYIDKVDQCCMTFVGTVKGPDPECSGRKERGFHHADRLCTHLFKLQLQLRACGYTLSTAVAQLRIGLSSSLKTVPRLENSNYKNSLNIGLQVEVIIMVWVPHI